MKYRARRRVTSFDVQIDTEWGKRHADIVDVTEKGARLRIEVGNLKPGSEIAVALHGKNRAAKVIWNKEGEAGIAFDEFLPLDVLAAVNHSLHRPKVEKKKRFLMR